MDVSELDVLKDSQVDLLIKNCSKNEKTFPTLNGVAEALEVKLHQLSKTPNLVAWEGEYFRIC